MRIKVSTRGYDQHSQIFDSKNFITPAWRRLHDLLLCDNHIGSSTKKVKIEYEDGSWREFEVIEK